MGSRSLMQRYHFLPSPSHTVCVVVHACSVVLHPLPCDPNVQSNSEGLDLVVEAIAKAGYTGKVVIGMDVAASEFYTADKVGHAVPSHAPCHRTRLVITPHVCLTVSQGVPTFLTVLPWGRGERGRASAPHPFLSTQA
jgi:hypothetical protein